MNVLDNSRCIMGKVFLPLPLEGSHISLLENGRLMDRSRTQSMCDDGGSCSRSMSERNGAEFYSF